jgi:hypothetical protein
LKELLPPTWGYPKWEQEKIERKESKASSFRKLID